MKWRHLESALHKGLHWVFLFFWFVCICLWEGNKISIWRSSYFSRIVQYISLCEADTFRTKAEADTTGWPSCDSCFDAFSHTHKDKQTQTHNNEHMHSIIISSINWWWSRIDTSGKGNFYIIVWTPFLIGFSVVIILLTHNIFAFITVAIVKIANSIIGIVTPSPPPFPCGKIPFEHAKPLSGSSLNITSIILFIINIIASISLITTISIIIIVIVIIILIIIPSEFIKALLQRRQLISSCSSKLPFGS